MKRSYETFDHTADIGLYAYGEGLEELFAHAGQGFTQIVTEVECVQALLKRSIAVKAETNEGLLQRFLSELLFLLDSESLLFSRFAVELSPGEARIEAEGEPFDASRHPFKTEVKAVTLHQLKIEKKGESYQATVVFDL